MTLRRDLLGFADVDSLILIQIITIFQTVRNLSSPTQFIGT